MNKRLIWTLGGVIVGVCTSLALTCSYGAMKSFKTPEQRELTIQKHEDGLTLKQLDKRVTKIEKILEIKHERKK